MNDVLLRAATTDDAAFLRAVYASTRAEELAQLPWTPEQKTAFCEMQFTAQDSHYRREYPDAQFLIIEHRGTPAGRLLVDRSEQVIHIIDIALLPEHRNLGIGTHLLSELMNEAAAAGKTVTIHVETFNPALKLYQRLGFRQIEDMGIYLLMEWKSE